MTLSLDLIRRLVATALPKSVVSFLPPPDLPLVLSLSPRFRLPFLFLFAAIKQNKVLT